MFGIGNKTKPADPHPRDVFNDAVESAIADARRRLDVRTLAGILDDKADALRVHYAINNAALLGAPMLLSFLAGIIIGAAALAGFALHVSPSRSKPETTRTINAIGMDLNGNSTQAQSLHEATRIFRSGDYGEA
jgi:hypothetical protein